MAEDWFEVNREMWDERVPIHVGSELYDVEAFVAGRSSLRPFELAELPDVRGRTLVHPQCHFGEDTLSLARLGAEVTGLDFSAPAIEAARALAARCGLEAEFVEANVYDAAEALGGRRFDIVYTGIGALNWLPDVERWAHVMASLVKPDGCLYLAEFHPFTHVFGDDDFTLEYRTSTTPRSRSSSRTAATTPIPAPRRSTTARSSGITASAPSSARSSARASSSSSCTSTTTRCSRAGRSWSGSADRSACRRACRRCRSCIRCAPCHAASRTAAKEGLGPPSTIDGGP